MRAIADSYKFILACRLKRMTDRQIAASLKISFATLKKMTDSDEFKMVLDLAVGLVSGEIPYHPAISAKEQVLQMGELPEEIQRKIAEDDTIAPNVRLKATELLQDRVGGKATEHILLDDPFTVLRRVHGQRIEQGMIE